MDIEGSIMNDFCGITKDFYDVMNDFYGCSLTFHVVYLLLFNNLNTK